MVARSARIHTAENRLTLKLLHGQVLRGTEEGRKCSFVDKAIRVTAAGAVGVIVVNNEDTLLSPGGRPASPFRCIWFRL